MCGRYTSSLDWDKLHKLYGVFDPVEPPPNAFQRRWNAAPTQDLPVCRHNPKSGRRVVGLLRWGLVPHWAKDAKIAFSTINAKAETLATAPAFRLAFAKRRCLVPAGGFYEWRKLDAKTKQPYYVTRADGLPMSFAGLWEGWQDKASGEWLHSFTIVTTQANALTAPIHQRMPVILDEADWPAWLGETEASPTELQALLRPWPDERTRLWPVAQAVGNVRNDGPELAEPVQAA